MAAHGRSWPRSRHVAFRGPSKAWKASRSSTKHRADADVTSAVALSLLSLPSRSSEPRLDGRSTLLVFQPPITGPPTPRARNSLPQASAESLRPHQRELPEILRGAACHARLRTLRRWLHGFARQRTASRLNVKLEFIEYGLSVQTASRRPPTRGPASTLTEFPSKHSHSEVVHTDLCPHSERLQCGDPHVVLRGAISTESGMVQPDMSSTCSKLGELSL